MSRRLAASMSRYPPRSFGGGGQTWHGCVEPLPHRPVIREPAWRSPRASVNADRARGVEGGVQGRSDGERVGDAGGVEAALEGVADRADEGEAGPVGVGEAPEGFLVAEAERGEVDDERPNCPLLGWTRSIGAPRPAREHVGPRALAAGESGSPGVSGVRRPAPWCAGRRPPRLRGWTCGAGGRVSRAGSGCCAT